MIYKVKWFSFDMPASPEDEMISHEHESEFGTLERAREFALECYNDLTRAVHSDNLDLIAEENL